MADNAQNRDWGLTREEAARRLGKYGANTPPLPPQPGIMQRFLAQIKDPMVLILLAAAALSAAAGEVTDSIIILAVVFLNGLLGMYQEGKASKAAAALAALHSPTARVLREGRVQEISAAEVVIGDVVLLEAGDTVPADMILFSATALKVDESSLTGESIPVNKQAAPYPTADPPPQNTRIFAGCSVVYGRGQGIVIATGKDSSLGKIAEMLNSSVQPPTPLQKKTARLSKFLSIGVLVICLLVFLLSVFTAATTPEQNSILASFMLAVSLAVAAIPEGLVVALTVVLAMGMKRMGRKNAIIRRLSAVETLGSVQVICSDKTGTLTQNRMSVCHVQGEKPLLALAARCCNNAVLTEQEELGDPTELALLRFAGDCSTGEFSPPLPRLGELPFDSERKLMTTLHETAEGKKIAFTKGAPEQVLARCTHVYAGFLSTLSTLPTLADNADYPHLAHIPPRTIIKLTDPIREKILEENRLLAGRALRILAIAVSHTDKKSAQEENLIFAGFIGMADPLRPEAKAAVAACKKAGIKVVIVTGDHPDTAAAIGKQLGILEETAPLDPRIITGEELAKMTDKELKKMLPQISVFARVLPRDKLRIVGLWQELGKVTAMTGDGVNDAPALKAADIGCAMGVCGSEVSRQAGHMVLADDNFATIISAVGEGRRIYDNIRKVTAFLLSSNLAEVFAVLTGTLLGVELFLPVHLLWINLITDCFPALALGLEPAAKNIFSRPPVSPKEGIFAHGLAIDITWQGAVAAILTVSSFAWGAPFGKEAAMSMAFLTLTTAELTQAFNMRDLQRSIFRLETGNTHLLLCAAAALLLNTALLYIPPLAALFGLTPLSAPMYGIAIILGLLMLLPVELAKWVKKTLRYK